MVFQNHSLLPWLSCFGNVYLAVERVLAKENKPAQGAHHAALDMVKMTTPPTNIPMRFLAA